MTNQKSQYPSMMLNYLASGGICQKVGFICYTDVVALWSYSLLMDIHNFRFYYQLLLLSFFIFFFLLARWVSGISVVGATWGRQKANIYHRRGCWWVESGFSSVKHGSNSLKTCGWEFIGGVRPMPCSTFATLKLPPSHRFYIYHVLGSLVRFPQLLELHDSNLVDPHCCMSSFCLGISSQ